MKIRNIRFQCWLSESEYCYLKKLAEKSGLSCGVYMRSLLYGFIPTDLPPPNYHAMMNELRAIANIMNQIAQRAHIRGMIDSKKYDEGLEVLKQAIIEIVTAVNKPRKIERKIE